jgi:hypothetical protein
VSDEPGTAPNAGQSEDDVIGDDVSQEQSAPVRLRLRRAPRYRAFGFTGAGIGVLAGVILALSFTASGDYSIRTIAGYFAASFGLVGALIGLGAAVLIERRRN